MHFNLDFFFFFFFAPFPIDLWVFLPLHFPTADDIRSSGSDGGAVALLVGFAKTEKMHKHGSNLVQERHHHSHYAEEEPAYCSNEQILILQDPPYLIVLQRDIRSFTKGVST